MSLPCDFVMCPVVKVEPLPEIDVNRASDVHRAKIGEIFHLSMDHLSFLCVHCNEEFSLYMQFVDHIQAHLTNILSAGMVATPVEDNNADDIDIDEIKQSWDDEDDGSGADDCLQPESDIDGSNDNDPTNSVAESLKFECPECLRKFVSCRAVKIHQRSHLSDNPKRNYPAVTQKDIEQYECYLCRTTSETKSEAKKHMRESHVSIVRQEYKCIRCSFKTQNKENLAKHALTCCGEECVCGICGQMFVSRATKLEHMSSHDKPYQCDECGARYWTNSKLLVHKAKHATESNFTCDECSKSFKSLTGLMYHKKVHKGIYPYRCEHCSKGFHSKYKLGVHTFKVHQTVIDGHRFDVKVSCPMCKKILSNSDSLQRHMRRHTGKALRCPICDLGKFAYILFISENYQKQLNNIHICSKCRLCRSQ